MSVRMLSVKNVMYVKKYYIWNHATCSCENEKYLASIMNDSAIMSDEIIELFDKAAWKTQSIYVLLVFLLIIMPLMIALSIYCYLIKYQSIQKHLLPFHVANNELKKIKY